MIIARWQDDKAYCNEASCGRPLHVTQAPAISEDGWALYLTRHPQIKWTPGGHLYYRMRELRRAKTRTAIAIPGRGVIHTYGKFLPLQLPIHVQCGECQCINRVLAPLA